MLSHGAAVRVARDVRRVLGREGGRWLAAEPYFPGLMMDASDDQELATLLRDRQIAGRRRATEHNRQPDENQQCGRNGNGRPTGCVVQDAGRDTRAN